MPTPYALNTRVSASEVPCMHTRTTLMLDLVDVMLCCCLGFGTLCIHCLYPLVFGESWMWAISFLRRSGRVTMTSARLMNVRNTDLLCWRLKFKYWSVWVGLRCTVACVLQSLLMFTQASRKGNLPSCSGSVVHLMFSPGC